jgi:hypothetical protein
MTWPMGHLIISPFPHEMIVLQIISGWQSKSRQGAELNDPYSRDVSGMSLIDH